MKSKQVIILLLLVLCLSVLGIVACKPNTVSGTYYYYGNGNYDKNNYIKLDKDTWANESGENGKYKVNGDNVTLYINFFGSEQVYASGTIFDGIMRITFTDNNYMYFCQEGKVPSGDELNSSDIHTHTYEIEWTCDETHHWHKATCEHANEISGRAEHNFVNNVCSICNYERIILRANGFTINDEELYIKVPNDTMFFNFNDKITVAENYSWVLANDINGENVIVTKTISLPNDDEYDKVVYIIVVGNDSFQTYKVTVHRRLMFSVTFDVGNGMAITQEVEEDGFATPLDSADIPQRAGYTYMGYDFDFNAPITSNILVNKIIWQANITYVDSDGLSQHITDDIEILTIAEDKMLSGWYLLSGTAIGDFTLTVGGEAHIILADDCNWTVNGGGIIVPSGNALYIYSQSMTESMGILSTNANIGGRDSKYTNGSVGIDSLNAGTIVINGGKVNATNIGGGNGYKGRSGVSPINFDGGFGLDGSVGGNVDIIEINGGTVSAINIGGGNGGNGGRGGDAARGGGQYNGGNGGDGGDGGDGGSVLTIKLNGGDITVTRLGAGDGGNGGNGGNGYRGFQVSGRTGSGGDGGNGGSAGKCDIIIINNKNCNITTINGGIEGNGGKKGNDAYNATAESGSDGRAGRSSVFAKIFYNGTSAEWDRKETSARNAIVYFYSENKPTSGGYYWHYDIDGVTPLVWN